VRGSNQLVLEEAERSLHDALCVVRALVKKRFLVPGGASVEMEVA
jgi:T-complex protein 1 subunit delta